MEYKRNFGNYRQLMNVPPFEICGMAEDLSHPFYSFLVQWIIPAVLEKKCPLKGEDFRMYNLSRQPELVSVWPDGYYRTFLSLHDELDNGIFNSTAIFKIKNTNNVEEF